MEVSSTTLPLLSFALMSWLDGSFHLRTASIATRPNRGSSISLPFPQLNNRYLKRIATLLRKPSKELGEEERNVMGLVDISMALLLMKAVGSGPILPMLLNPLTVVLPLPRKLVPGSILWSRVALMSIALSVFHEAERVSVSYLYGLLKKRIRSEILPSLSEVLVRGEPHLPKEDEDPSEDEDVCLICSGGLDSTMSDSITSLSSSQTPSLGPLEEFCVNAPQMHLMHRECFLAWHKSYREQHTRPVQPMIVSSEADHPEDRDREKERSRVATILAMAGISTRGLLLISPDDALLLHRIHGRPRDDPVPEFKLSNPVVGSGDELLGTLTSRTPPCPGCRSPVKLCFTHLPPRTVSQAEKSNLQTYLTEWVRHWRDLVNSRTLLIKLVKQVAFVLMLTSVMKMKNSRTWLIRVL